MLTDWYDELEINANWSNLFTSFELIKITEIIAESKLKLKTDFIKVLNFEFHV